MGTPKNSDNKNAELRNRVASLITQLEAGLESHKAHFGKFAGKASEVETLRQELEKLEALDEPTDAQLTQINIIETKLQFARGREDKLSAEAESVMEELRQLIETTSDALPRIYQPMTDATCERYASSIAELFPNKHNAVVTIKSTPKFAAYVSQFKQIYSGTDWKGIGSQLENALRLAKEAARLMESEETMARAF